ncbi:MAG: HAD-IA family hydrolase [Micromonosporaceae bacterium]
MFAPPPAPRRSSDRRPVDAVLFDFHGTIAQLENRVNWMVRAAEACGVHLERTRAAELADRLDAVGWPVPAQVPAHLVEVFARRDLSEAAHRAAYTGLAATVASGIDGLPDALYERVLRPDGWVVYADTVPTLRALRAAGIPVAVVSNIGFDIRPLLAAFGIASLVDAVVLSYEVGLCKPDPAIFQHACGLLGVEPERALMVGDTPADAGAVSVGCRVLVVPARGPGEVNGLAGALDLARVTGTAAGADTGARATGRAIGERVTG